MWEKLISLFVCIQDAPDSPKDDGVPPGSLVAPPMASVTPMEGVESGGPGEMRSRHLLYTTHFPLPQVRITFIAAMQFCLYRMVFELR